MGRLLKLKLTMIYHEGKLITYEKGWKQGRLFLIFPHEKTTFQLSNWFLRPYFSLIRGMFYREVVLDFRFGHCITFKGTLNLHLYFYFRLFVFVFETKVPRPVFCMRAAEGGRHLLLLHVIRQEALPRFETNNNLKKILTV